MSRATALGRLAVVGALAVTLAGCSGSPKAPTATKPPAAQLAVARTALEKSPAVALTLSATGLPASASGVSGGTGTGLFSPPSFKGTLNASVAGVTGTVAVIAVDHDVFMKFFTPGYVKVDPKTYGAPNPAELFNRQTGITSLLPRTTHLAQGPTVRSGSDVLHTITGELPGAAVADLLVVGDRSGTFDVTYGLTDTGGELRSIVLKGPFYAGSTSTYTVGLKTLSQPVVISRP